MSSADNFTKEQATEWLRNVGLAVSGSKEELNTRIQKYLRYPKLLEKLQNRVNNNYKFPCSLDPQDIPPANAAWKMIDGLLPAVSQSTFEGYCKQKKEGTQGQQKKALQMLQSRKIVWVKVLLVENNLFVKAMIKKSYGHDSRPAVIMFENRYPIRSHCNCVVGTSGLCCHVLALLLFLKHFSETGESM